jgi:hypothetical protein
MTIDAYLDAMQEGFVTAGCRCVHRVIARFSTIREDARYHSSVLRGRALYSCRVSREHLRSLVLALDQVAHCRQQLLE